MNTFEKYTEWISDLIAKDDIKTAISELSNLLKKSKKLDELIIQSARYNDITQQIKLGIVDYEQANITKNNIRFELLNLLRDIEEIAEKNISIKSDIEQHLNKSHSVSGDNAAHNKDFINIFSSKLMIVVILIIIIAILIFYSKSETYGIKGNNNDENNIEITK